MQNRSLTAFVCCLLLFLVGCSQLSDVDVLNTADKTEMGSILETVNTLDDNASSTQITNEIDCEIHKYSKPVETGYEYEIIGADDSNLYYAKKKPKPMGTTVLESYIVSISRDDGSEIELLEIKHSDPDEPFFVNEEKIIDSGICWSLYDHTGCQIQFFDNKMQYIIDIKHIYGARNINLNANNDYITWTEWTLIDDESPHLEGNMYVYDIKKGEVNLISDAVYSISPYVRAPITDDTCAFVEIIDDLKYICLYDLSTMNYIYRTVTDLHDPANLMTTDGKIIYSDGCLDGLKSLDIYMIDCGNGKTVKIHSVTEKHDIFSFHLAGRFLIINDDQESATIVVRNIDSLITSDIVKIPDGYLVYGRVTVTDSYIVEDLSNRTIYICKFY